MIQEYPQIAQDSVILAILKKKKTKTKSSPNVDFN